MKILLVGNYPNDAQESMQRFAAMMLNGLRTGGIPVELLVPKPYFGRLLRSGHGIGKWLGYIDKFLIFPFALKKRISALQVGGVGELVVHICDHSNAFYTRLIPQIPNLVTCHDMLAIRSAFGEFPENFTRWSGRCLQFLILSGLRRAHHVVCDSNATCRDFLRLEPSQADKVSVIPISLNYRYSPMPSADAWESVRAQLMRATKRDVELPDGFILHVGGNQWYKNRVGVVRIYSRLVSTVGNAPALVLVGKPFTPEMSALLASNNLQGRVFLIEGCNDEELRALYSVAKVLLFPSLAEGFGWPVLEAQACACPVVCSDVASLPEVAGDGALMRHPEDEDGFILDILKLLFPGEREALIERGLANADQFGSETMLATYSNLYHRLIEQNQKVPVGA